MADPRVQERLKEHQIVCPEVDLSVPNQTSHTRYWHNLHLVMARDWRYMKIGHEVLCRLRAMSVKASEPKGNGSRGQPFCRTICT